MAHINEMKARSIGIKWWYDFGNGRTVEGDLVHDELKRMFEVCGPVEEIIPNMGPGIAYLRFESKDAMPKALEMHNTTYKGGSRNREGTLKVYAGGSVPDRSPSSARPPSSGKGSGPPQHELDRVNEMKARSIGIKWWVDHGNGRTTEGDWDENEIKTMFSPCGSVEEVMLMGPGIAYLRFDNKDAMPQALEMHNTTYTGGRRNRPGTLKVYQGGKVPDRSPSSARPGGKGGGKGGGGGGKGEIDERKARSIGIKWWIDIGNGRSVEGDLVHDEIERMFEPCGPVEEIIPNMGPGIAYLRFESKDAMPKALEMHKTTYKGGSRNREGTLKVYAGGLVPDRSPPSSRPPADESDDEDKGGLPRSAPSLRRVCGGKGWVVHGLLFEYSDGVRTGFFGNNDNSPLSLNDDAGISRRNGEWQDVSPGEELVSISGHNSTMGYLCGSISLRLSSGRVIEYKGDNAGKFGATFTHDAPASPGGYHEPTFADGRCTGLKPIATPP